MVEECAMPFAASIQSVLETELSLQCRMGGTFAKAYCGVVGGVMRHEYSVLGPSVNLSARLMGMGDPQNGGFLIDAGVHRRAKNWEFRALTPVPAKGYRNPVRVYEPVLHKRRPWKKQNQVNFVGRVEELEAIVRFAQDVLSSKYHASKMVLISSGSGGGKSSLMSEAIAQIQSLCEQKARSFLMAGQTCFEGDLFCPLSVVGHIFLDILFRSEPHDPNEKHSESNKDTDSFGSGTSSLLSYSVERFVAACQLAQIPKRRIETIHSLVFDHAWPREKNDTCSQDDIARSIAAIILHCTVDFDLVLIALDDCAFMDSLSWDVLQMIFEHGSNFLIVATSRPISCSDMNVSPSFWDFLYEDGTRNNSFLHLDLYPLGEADVRKMIAAYFDEASDGKPSAKLLQEHFAREVLIQSCGNPRVVCSMAANCLDAYSDTGSDYSLDDGIDFEILQGGTKAALGDNLDITDHIIHKIDSLPAIVRTHVNLGAILCREGLSFDGSDVVRVMEKYRGVCEEEIQEHAHFVQESLNEAARRGVLEREQIQSNDEVEFNLSGTSLEGNGVIPSKYRFAHEVWRNNVLKLLLKDWQREMQNLIEECLSQQTKKEGN